MIVYSRYIILCLSVLILAGCNSIEPPLPINDISSSPTPQVEDNPPQEKDGTVQAEGEIPTVEFIQPTLLPTLTPTPMPSPTPAPVLRQLTSGGCCSEPFWSPDGNQVMYIDRPSPDEPSGLWGINIQTNTPGFITDRLGIFSPDMQLRAFPVNGVTSAEHLTTGEQWGIPNGGRGISFSPDSKWVAWTAGQFSPPFDSAQREVWISRFNGSDVRQVFTTTGGGFGGWLDDHRLLVSGRIDGAGSEMVYWALNLDDSQGEEYELLELGRGGRLREAKISPDGHWLAYLVTFSQDPNRDGIWLVDTHSGDRRHLDVFGGYNWRDGEKLLVVPMDLSQPVHRLIQVQASNGQVEPITDPESTPFKIANGDWRVSPDGNTIAFLSAEDGNIWLLELPNQ
jgi:Tol biopolymer transport system component